MGGRNKEEETDCGFSAIAAENFVLATIACTVKANGTMA